MQKNKCKCEPASKEARILVIYTGGTIGMIRNDDGVLVPIKNELLKRLREYPNCHDKAYNPVYACNGEPPLVLPATEGARYRVVYHLIEYMPLLDSSCMEMNDWRRIATDVGQSYNYYDGFVVLHGTDTMAYTASALAFMLQNLDKPVVITGGQIPILEVRSDGRDNFIGSLLVASNYNIPEVLVFFGNKILRGCRTTKISSDSLHAFDSPNHSPIGMVGAQIDINSRHIFRPCGTGHFSVHRKLETNVGLLRIYPGITPAVLHAFFSEPMKGVVIQSFGTGNMPINQKELINEVSEAINRGVLIVTISQCANGSIDPIYETSQWMKLGIVAGYDMTQEAALTKLAYVLGKTEWNMDHKKKIMQTSIRGEMTTAKVPKISEIDLIEGVARTLRVSCCKGRYQMSSTFYPALIEEAIRRDDAEQLKVLKEYGANICEPNCEGRSPLHIACYLRKQKCVDYLLESGCPVNITDRFDRTPLHEAIDTDNHELIILLLSKGAVLPDDALTLAEQLRVLTEHDKINRIDSYRLAGADLTVADGTGRTALHYACHLGKRDVVQYLVPYYTNPSVKDQLGLGPIQYAKAAEHQHIVEMLCAHKNQ